MSESKVERHSVMVEPTAFKQLEERLSRAEAAKAIGLSTSTFNLTKTDGKVRMVTELAARHLLSKLDKSASEPKVVLARVPADKVEMVRQFLDAVGAKHQCV